MNRSKYGGIQKESEVPAGGGTPARAAVHKLYKRCWRLEMLKGLDRRDHSRPRPAVIDRVLPEVEAPLRSFFCNQGCDFFATLVYVE